MAALAHSGFVVEAGFPRPVWVLGEDGRRHGGWVLAARRDPGSGRWRGFVDYTDRDDHRTGGHFLHWLDEGQLLARSGG